MATFYPHFGLARKIGASEIQMDVGTVQELIDEGIRRYGDPFKEELASTAILVNGRNINFLKGYKTRLQKEDRIWFVVPVAGG